MRIDPWAGWQQYLVFATQFALDEKKNIGSGEIVGSNQFPFETRAGKAIQFARKKLAPTSSIPVDWAFGKDVLGNEFSVGQELQKTITPMALSDFYSAIDEAGILGTLAGAYSIYGGGVQVYDQQIKEPFTQPKPIQEKAKKRKTIKFGN